MIHFLMKTHRLQLLRLIGKKSLECCILIKKRNAQLPTSKKLCVCGFCLFVCLFVCRWLFFCLFVVVFFVFFWGGVFVVVFLFVFFLFVCCCCFCFFLIIYMCLITSVKMLENKYRSF